MISQRGGFVLGIVVGLLAGLALALGVALYITKAPVPFINKVPNRTAEQDSAETERNRNWDPNALLGGKAVHKPAVAPGSASAPAAAPPAAAPPVASVTAPPPPAPPLVSAPPPPSRDPGSILSGAPSTANGAEAFVYFVQVGAYTRIEEADQQRAKLALIGYSAKVTEREQAGRTVFRVRVGPYESREEADGVQGRLNESSIEARLVRVERQ